MDNDLKFEAVKENDLPVIKDWFRLPFFYFDTHEPDKIPLRDVEFILKFPKAHYLLVKYNNEPIGLLDFILLNESVSATFELAFSNFQYWDEIGEGVLKKFLRLLFLKYPIKRAEKWVYEFDILAKECLSRIGLKKEGIIRSVILKDKKFYDIEVYSAYEKEWR